jgi:hypothetical protein
MYQIKPASNGGWNVINSISLVPVLWKRERKDAEDAKTELEKDFDFFGEE